MGKLVVRLLGITTLAILPLSVFAGNSDPNTNTDTSTQSTTDTGTGTGTTTDTSTHTHSATFTYTTVGVSSSTTTSAMADTDHNPDQKAMLQSFDWQQAWGSIHINSYADGVQDPGSPATSDGQVPCNTFTKDASGNFTPNICSNMGINFDPHTGLVVPNPSLNAYPAKFDKSTGTFPQLLPISESVDGQTSVLTNPIKYDIKNSLVNCMSKAVPNWAIQHGGPASAYGYQQTVCNALSSVAGVTLNPNFDQGAPTTSNYNPTLYYFPFYDPRTNDLQTIDSGNKPGCMQQVTNTCGSKSKQLFIRDIHDCLNTSPAFPSGCAAGQSCDGPGFTHPVTHVFSTQEVNDLGLGGTAVPHVGGQSLPQVYWAYDKKDSSAPGGHRMALTVNDPKDATDAYTGADAKEPIKINNISDPILARLKSFNLTIPTMGKSPVVNFTIMDPSDFFDMKLYTPGGAHDSGYTSYVNNNSPSASSNYAPTFPNNVPATPDTCPVMGITGYSGICDPIPEGAMITKKFQYDAQGNIVTSGGIKQTVNVTPFKHENAGCNIPIYGIGPTTSFTDENQNQYTYAPATITWSGYVRSWQMITVDHYLNDIKGLENIYMDSENSDGAMFFNDNPILKVTRSSDYCEPAEMVSAGNMASFLAGQSKPDLTTCTQYLQYELTDVKNGHEVWQWMDLYMPPTDIDPQTTKPRADFMHMYNIKKSILTGLYDYEWTNPLKGSGTDNRYLKGYDPKNPLLGNYLTLMDDTAHGGPQYFDARTNESFDAVQHAKIVTSGKDANGNTIQTVGVYLNGVDNSAGVGLGLERGMRAALRMPQPLNINGTEQTCAFLDTGWPSADDLNGGSNSPQVFLPTNSQAEMQHFITALSSPNPPPGAQGVTVRPCGAKYAPNTVDGLNPKADGSNLRPDHQGKTWFGKLTCADLIGDSQPMCNSSRKITLERMCQYESGMFGDCDACNGVAEDAADQAIPAIDATSAGNAQYATAFKGKTLYQMWQMFYDDDPAIPPSMDIVSAPQSPLAKIQKGDKCKFLASCFAMNSANGGCPAAGTVGGHVFCLSGDTKITMADGSLKEISKIKAGEKVKAFDSKNARNMALADAKVKATAITKKQEIVQINKLRITPLHKVLLASGRAVEAKDVKVGDKILRDSGAIEEVTTVNSKLSPITVYNLVLESDDLGYIAGGYRVLSYPTPRGMDAKAKALGGGANRKVSSLKKKQ